MPVNPASLQAALQALAEGPGSSVHDAAQGWADAIEAYAVSVVPASTSVAAATPGLSSALETAFGQLSSAAAIEAAFSTWAATACAGMAPAFVPTPPPAPIGLAGLFAAAYPADHTAAAARMSNAIDTWFRTGTGTPAAGGGPVPWT